MDKFKKLVRELYDLTNDEPQVEVDRSELNETDAVEIIETGVQANEPQVEALVVDEIAEPKTEETAVEIKDEVISQDGLVTDEDVIKFLKSKGVI